MRVSTRTIYNRLHAGELKAFRFGHGWRITRQDLTAGSGKKRN